MFFKLYPYYYYRALNYLIFKSLYPHKELVSTLVTTVQSFFSAPYVISRHASTTF